MTIGILFRSKREHNIAWNDVNLLESDNLFVTILFLLDKTAAKKWNSCSLLFLLHFLYPPKNAYNYLLVCQLLSVLSDERIFSLFICAQMSRGQIEYSSICSNAQKMWKLSQKKNNSHKNGLKTTIRQEK